MLGDAIQPEIHELIEQKEFATLKRVLGELDVHDVAELLGSLEGRELGVAFRLLSRDRAAEVFANLELEQQEDLLGILSGEDLAEILNDMPPDDRTGLLEDLPEEVAARLIASLSPDEREVARELLHYPEDSIGRLMTPEYVAVRANWTIRQVLEHIRQVAPEKETLNMLFVVDEAGKLVDQVRLEDLVLADPDDTVGEILEHNPVYLVADEDREEAVEVFKKYDEVALPVVDADGVLVGIVTHDDVMDVQEEEDTEDFHKMAAVAALEEPYFATTGAEMLRKRLPWLGLLFAAEILTVLALTGFEQSLESFALIVLFMPLINATAGNAGAQMAGLVIRGLAVHEMKPGDWLRILGRELALGATMGATLGVMGLVAAAIMLSMRAQPPVGQELLAKSAGVGISIGAAVIFANIAGGMIPLLFKRIGLDPAVTSGPFLACVMDISGVLIYFTIATAMLAALGMV
ncbi:MAG: magnesium transporter [Planctomycetota bacterium]|jgi:magnesium transporter